MKAKLLVALLSVLAALLVLAVGSEVAAQVGYYRWRAGFDNEGWLDRLTIASPNPVLLWEYRPYGEAGGVLTNRYGFRDVDYETPAKAPGVRRTAFIGDSVTLGMGVPPGQTFAALAGELSTKTGLAIQTLNFGVDGYNALQIGELLTARVLAFQPDHVVYVLCLNDFDFTDSSGRKTSYFRKPRFFLPLSIERRYRALRGTEFHHFHYEQHRTEVFEAIEAMAATARTNRARFTLAIVPVFPDRTSDAEYFARYPFRDIHEGIRLFAASREMRVHDLLDDFARQPPPPGRYALDLWHLSAEGHRVVAEALAPDLGPDR